MLGSVTDGIILTVKNDSVIGDNMGFPGERINESLRISRTGAQRRDRKTGERDNDNGVEP